MVNKQIFYLSILLAFTSCGNRGEKNESNLRSMSNVAKIKNLDIQDSIRQYYYKNLKQYDKGVITLHVTNDNDTSVFIISSILSSFNIAENLPSLYAEVDSIPILLFTGVENEVEQDRAYIKEVQKRIYPHLEEVPPNYNPVAWRIKTVSQRIVDAEIIN